MNLSRYGLSGSKCLIFDRAEHPDRRVAALAVVEDLRYTSIALGATSVSLLSNTTTSPDDVIPRFHIAAKLNDPVNGTTTGSGSSASPLISLGASAALLTHAILSTICLASSRVRISSTLEVDTPSLLAMPWVPDPPLHIHNSHSIRSKSVAPSLSGV